MTDGEGDCLVGVKPLPAKDDRFFKIITGNIYLQMDADVIIRYLLYTN